jgi:hypothetical protein
VIPADLHIFEKKQQQKNDRIVNIDKEKYEINSLHVYSCYDFSLSTLLRLASERHFGCKIMKL